MKKTIIRTIELFFTMYLLGQLYTFLLFNESISNNLNNSTVAITYLFQFAYIILVVSFFKLFKIPYNLVKVKKNILGKSLFSFILLYLSLSTLYPITREINKDYLDFSFNWENWNGTKNLFIIMIFLGPIFEELFFRQILLKPFLKDKQTMWIGLIITTFLFAVSHFYIINSHFNINYYFLEMLVFGFILSVVRVRFGLFFSIIAHVIHNFIALLYKENIGNLFYLDYINNAYFFWISYILALIFTISSVVYMTKIKHLN